MRAETSRLQNPNAGSMEKLSAMNLHKDFWLVIVPAVMAATVAQMLHESPTVVMMQVDWAIEFSRLIHALTEPTTVAAIVATLGALGRYEICKRRLRRKHEEELQELREELRRLKGRDDDAA